MRLTLAINAYRYKKCGMTLRQLAIKTQVPYKGQVQTNAAGF